MGKTRGKKKKIGRTSREKTGLPHCTTPANHIDQQITVYKRSPEVALPLGISPVSSCSASFFTCTGIAPNYASFRLPCAPARKSACTPSRCCLHSDSLHAVGTARGAALICRWDLARLMWPRACERRAPHCESSQRSPDASLRGREIFALIWCMRHEPCYQLPVCTAIPARTFFSAR